MAELAGVGLGLRREFIDAFLNADTHPDFIEVAPENWMGFGGRHAKLLAQCVEKAPLICHGLSLSLGGPHPLNIEFIQQVKNFLQRYQVQIYSEHLSYTHDGGYLYDLLPIPMTEAAANYVAERILRVQDILGQRLVIENVSTYLMPNAEMREAEFVREVLLKADCELLLDVNNVYVNSINHGSDAYTFIDAMPKDRIRYLHVAGHEQVEKNLLIDTHGAAISDPVWQLLKYSYQVCGVKPTLLERDFNIPSWQQLQNELTSIKNMQQEGRDEGKANILSDYAATVL
ncbi:HvfB family MNIO-type RiPP peptide maturase [Acinetobacter proteolyticus]|uniref:HvfB family MNIO-type RiPP peptide maturase n=1 Tax=Acinetobacter proteolyticus TaxID=1776741 RepID=UPI003D97BD80